MNNPLIKSNPASLSPAALVTNALLFQGLWFSAMLLDWLWALIPFILLLIHSFAVKVVSHQFVYRVLCLLPLGLIFDGAMIATDVYHFPDSPQALLGMPIFLIMMWVGFLSTYLASMNGLLRYSGWFPLMCAVAGPLSYFAAQRLGVVEIKSIGYLPLSLFWFAFGHASERWLRRENA